GWRWPRGASARPMARGAPRTRTQCGGRRRAE
ncbi:hypothetical protein TSOC_004550, partial [Tetrabaena socialis]